VSDTPVPLTPSEIEALCEAGPEDAPSHNEWFEQKERFLATLTAAIQVTGEMQRRNCRAALETCENANAAVNHAPSPEPGVVLAEVARRINNDGN